MPGGGLITPRRFLPHHSDLTGDLLAFPAGHFQDVSFHGMLEAAGDGAIMAGPVGPTPPMLDGGEWTHLLAEAPHSRAQGMVRSAPESSAREKAKPTGYEKNNHLLAARPQTLRLWPVKKNEDFA